MAKAAVHKHELPPPEQLARGGYSEEPLTPQPGAPKRLRRLDSDLLDKALMDKWISIDQHTTLERFRGELYKAGLVFCPRAGAEVSGTSGQGQFLADAAFHRARRVGLQMSALAKAMPAGEINLALGLLTMDEPINKKQAVVLHQVAETLDKLYEWKR